jgi:hypothetical protein
MGIWGVALKWFQSYPESMEQRVEITFKCEGTNEITNYLSWKRPIRHGIPQGCSWTSVVFAIFWWSGSQHWTWKTKIFADDTSILITGNGANVVQRKINGTINNLTEWFERTD